MLKLEKNKAIEVPESLYARIEAKIKGTRFESVSEYASYVLREKLATEESSSPGYSKEEEEKIQARLKALGYL
ncbi:MAG: CopG family transcriptional regulator [Candidatus Bathyarchaeia archaeon]|jgi:Arc/MetJ-type ribon-helix-helix transcriptional regulator